MVSKILAKILIIFIGAISTHNILLAETDKVIVAGGCFWCVEADFEGLDGVKEAISGYTGGTLKNPSYKEVVQGGTGHYEAVEIEFDSSVISLDKILYIFLRSVDVTDDGGQFCDRGESYRTAIFTKNKSQNEKAHSAIENAQDELGRKIVTKVLELKNFYIAEDYHQNYYKGENFVLTRFGPRKQSKAYKLYRNSCKRDDIVKELWGSSAQFTE
ncbi:peptide-methionine (S)-S-oxide reductase MsrA [Paracoccaceae bacterium]|nr:peptide-methionine (S)-S-oxide reductase MsrA [Paracoccaceae bacterium]